MGCSFGLRKTGLCAGDSGAIYRQTNVEIELMSEKQDLLSPLAGEALPQDTASRQLAIGSLAIVALAIGALAIGALAIGALAVGRLSVGRGYIRKLRIGELEVEHLIIRSTQLKTEVNGA